MGYKFPSLGERQLPNELQWLLSLSGEIPGTLLQRASSGSLFDQWIVFLGLLFSETASSLTQ